MKIDMQRHVLVCGIVLLFLGTSIIPALGGTTFQSMDETSSTFTVISHPVTREEIDILKQKLGVYNPTKNYNIIIDGFGTGLAPPTEESYENMIGSIQKIDQVIPSAPLTATFDLSTDPCFPRVGNQQQQGSCAAWAATYYSSGYVIGKKYNWNLAFQGNSDQLLSPAWTYNKANDGVDHGSWMSDCMVVTQTVGTSRMSQMPYNDGDPVSWGTENAWRDAPSYRASTVYEVPHDINTIKAVVSNGNPITFAFDANSYNNFGTDDVLGSNAMLPNLNHGNTIVGYDDAKRDAQTGETGAFKIVNSWGYWGPTHNGYYWMTYQAFLGSWNEAPLNYVDCLYVPSHPTLLGVWTLNPQADRSASVELGIGPYGSPLETRTPWWDGYSYQMHTYPAFMCLDITEFYDKWLTAVDSFYLKIGNAAHDGTITSFKIEYYNSSYVPGNPTRISLESPDTPKNTPGYVTANIEIIDNTRPTWRNQGESSTGILRGTPITLYAQGKDNVALRWATLATNETGTWQNVTDKYGSPMNLGGVYEQWRWSNFTWQNPGIHQDRRIGWKIYYTDGSNNWNVTNVMSFLILSNPAITDHTPSVATTGDAFIFNVSILEDHGIAGVWVEYWYGTGAHTNVTMIPTGVGTYYERTIAIPAHSLDSLYYVISAKDGLNFWSNTGIKQTPVVDNDVPEWRNQGQSKTIVPPGESVLLSAQGYDNIALEKAWFASNETGEWLPFSGKEWWNLEWSYSKTIVIDHTKFQSNLVDFPFVISLTSSDFIGHAQSDGDDFVFIDESNTTRYNHEIEYFNSATGELVAWVNIPLISASQDTVLNLYYGNAVCENQQNVPATWASGYIFVHHMTGATYTDLKDSSMNHWDITSAAGTPTYNQPGKIGRCVDFDPTNGWDHLQAAGFRLPTDSTYTGSAWVYADGSASSRRYIFEGDEDNGISLLIDSNDKFLAVADTDIDLAYCYSTTPVNVYVPQWTYVCTRADVTTDQLDLFVNGIPDANDVINGSIMPEPTGLNIGTYMNNNNYYMNGRIDELRISNVARSNTWIRTEYEMMCSPQTYITVGSEQHKDAGTKYGSPMDLNGVIDQWIWSNFTWQNPEIPEGTTVGWRIYYFDSSENLVMSNVMTFRIGNDVEYSLTVNVDGNGYVIKDPDQLTYLPGTPVELTAISNPGWLFDHWSGNLAGNNNPETIIMDGDKVVTAHFIFNQMLLDGDCFYGDMSSVTPVSVEITNTNTGVRWQANTDNNHYSLVLTPGVDIIAGQTIRYIARDSNESVNVTDHVVTAGEISTGTIHQNLILRVHYRDLKRFPFTLSTVNSGAAVMKMMMDYLMWNRTQYPEGPISQNPEQYYYDTYAGGNYLNGTELSIGLNTEIDDHAHGWIYGYFFNPSAQDSADDALKSAVVWLDYNVSVYNPNRTVPVPKEGHPYHVPVAVPTGGDYNHWMTIRGIHTDRNAWDGQHIVTQPITIYGFWLNDPAVGGMGDNLYVTAQRFKDNYFTRLNVPGDTYNNKFLVITDPPRDVNVDTTTLSINTMPTEMVYSLKEAKQLQRAQTGFGLGGSIANNKIVMNAFEKANLVLKNDAVFGADFATSQVMKKPVYASNGEYTVTFRGSLYRFEVGMGQLGGLLQIRISTL